MEKLQPYCCPLEPNGEAVNGNGKWKPYPKENGSHGQRNRISQRNRTPPHKNGSHSQITGSHTITKGRMVKEAGGPGFRAMTQTTGRHPTTQQNKRGTKTTRRQDTNGAKAQTRTKIPTTARGQARGEKVTLTKKASGAAETRDRSAGSQSLSIYDILIIEGNDASPRVRSFC